jgi:membrane dipeptidase
VSQRFFADAHADSLMWNRDLSVRSSEGHVDFPRLLEAGVRLQCFTLVTQGFPLIGGFPVFAAWRGWPAAARKSPWTRALWQIDRLRAFCEASKGQVAVATSGAQLRENLAAGRLSAVLGVEGGQVLEGEAGRVAQLHAQGVRFLGPLHLTNNALGGSSFPLALPKPLTPFGHEVLEQMGKVGMAVDIAHASERTLEGIFAHRDVRPFCSHTGVRAQGGGARNLSDASLKALADRGGVAGIIFAKVYLGGSTLADVARHVAHAVKVMGREGVALGSDFDGMVALPRGMRGATELPLLADALSAQGLSSDEVDGVVGGNLFRFLSEVC